ncbi:BLUF domain-containing protein [Octadecabacter sp. R77987]|uniref:BLUF domain-containing protein n=1 Tax=Octadecabacter sp. R77987 TaxID=3093874 RepID=UPI0036725F1A
MKYIVYVSQAAKAFSTEELAGLLTHSRERNSADGISGLLIYRYNADFKRGNFLQVLEGSHEALDDVWRRISGDPRHHTIIVLDEGQTDERMFGEWSMGFRSVDASDLAKFAGFSELGSDEFWKNVKERSVPDALVTLRSFYDGV